MSQDPKNDRKEFSLELEDGTFVEPPQAKPLADGYAAALGAARTRRVLMHSPMGLRIELNIDQSTLELWLSPQADKSLDYRLRNFSNRDDHTCVFDRISLPGLNPQHYVRCDYDPFHSVLHYRDQRLHLLAMLDVPGVVLWCEAEEVIDLKSDKQDTPLRQDPQVFSVLHPDRGLSLQFAAVAGKGGAFQHQKSLDRGRSTYARLSLAAHQPLLIGGELDWEQPAELFERLAASEPAELLAYNEARVAEALAPARVVFRDRPDWQRQYDFNKRVLLSGQDHGGNMPAAFRSLYYLIWHMDGAVTAVPVGMTGWADFLERWAAFQLSNPTETDTPVPGRYFGQLVNGRISKQEEWGTYWATWSAFTHWTQTGSRDLVEGVYRENLLASVDWLERLCWDEAKVAFGTWYAGEDPFLGSHDFGYDQAVGCPMATKARAFQGQAVRRHYSYDFNLMMYNVYWMLSASGEGPEAEALADKARRLEPFLRSAAAEGGFARLVVLEDGREVTDPAAAHFRYGIEFMPDPAEAPAIIRRDERFDLTPVLRGQDTFAHQVLANLRLQDPVLFGSGDVETLLEHYLPQVRRAGAYLQMAGTLPENINCADGSYHDNRPQLFSTGLMQAVLVGRAIQRLPFGIAVRANPHIERIEQYEYQGCSLALAFEGAGEAVTAVKINGQPLPHSLQIPHDALTPETAVRVTLGDARPQGAALAWSSVQLASVQREGNVVAYHVEAFGPNAMAFTSRPADFTLETAEGTPVQPRVHEANGWCSVEFPGRGRFVLRMRP